MQAKDAAKDQNRWLLVNLQSMKEFSSHMVLLAWLTFFSYLLIYFLNARAYSSICIFVQLNRDTWANEAVAQTIKANFIFWQVRIVLLEHNHFFGIGTYYYNVIFEGLFLCSKISMLVQFA